jgi:flagellar protein FliO/FliZ
MLAGIAGYQHRAIMINLGTYLSAAAALAIVLMLVGAVAWLARRQGLIPRSASGSEFAVKETIALDARRRLHLVRCCGQHALLMTGGPQDLVVGWVLKGEATDGGRHEAPGSAP